MPHLTKPAPCKGQVLSPMEAHSVSGETASAITECCVDAMLMPDLTEPSPYVTIWAGSVTFCFEGRGTHVVSDGTVPVITE